VTRVATYEVKVAKLFKSDCIVAIGVSSYWGRSIACLETLLCNLLHVVELAVVIENKSITDVKILAGSPFLVVNLTHACPTSRVADLVDSSHGNSYTKAHENQKENHHAFIEGHG
jgi:hypothetical protein